MMYQQLLLRFTVIGAVLSLVACQSAAAGVTPVASTETPEVTPVTADATDTAPERLSHPIQLNTPLPSSLTPIVVSTPVAVSTTTMAPPTTAMDTPSTGTPVAQATETTVVQSTRTPSAPSTPAATVVTTPVGTPTAPAVSTPSATSTSADLPGQVQAKGSPELQALTIKLDDLVDNLREALREKDADTALRLQREILATLDQSEDEIQNEKSDLAAALRGIDSTLRRGLGGDLARIDDAGIALSKLTARPTTGDTIHDLYQYAGTVAGKITALKKARQSGDLGALFRIQNDLLREAARAQAELRPGRTKLTDQVLIALVDLEAGLEGNPARLDAAETKLNAIAKIPTSGASAATAAAATPAPSPAPSPTSSPTSAPKPAAPAAKASPTANAPSGGPAAKPGR